MRVLRIPVAHASHAGAHFSYRKVNLTTCSVVSEAVFFVFWYPLQGLYNVQTTSTKTAEEVLAELRRVVQEKNVLFRVKG